MTAKRVSRGASHDAAVRTTKSAKSATTGRFVSRTTASGARIIPLPPASARKTYHDRALEERVREDLARIDSRLRKLREA